MREELGMGPAAVAPLATRHDLQLGRRFFHFVNGASTATAYALLFTHQQVVHIFGTIACIVYVVDRADTGMHILELTGSARKVANLLIESSNPEAS